MEIRSLEIHEVWFGALYGAAGALLVNVFTAFGGEWAGAGAILSSALSLVLLVFVGKMRVDCQNKYKSAVEQRRPEQTKAQIYEDVIGSRQRKANLVFIIALLSLLIAIVSWLYLNVQRTRLADEERAQRDLRASIERISQTMERQEASIDTLSMRVREDGAETRALILLKCSERRDADTTSNQ